MNAGRPHSPGPRQSSKSSYVDRRAILKGIIFAAVVFVATVIGFGAAAVMEGNPFLKGLMNALDNSWPAWAAVILIFLLGAGFITCVEWRRNVKSNRR